MKHLVLGIAIVLATPVCFSNSVCQALFMQRSTPARLIIVAGPSGAGKNTLMEMLLKADARFADPISYTTRSMRQGEKPGWPYHFVDKQNFEQLIAKDFFLEWSPVHTNYYGTSKESLQQIWDQGKIAIMDIDIQGVSKIKAIYPDAVSVFIRPPSVESLRLRILSRDPNPPADLEIRLQTAEKEMKAAGSFDYQVVNDSLPNAFGEFSQLSNMLISPTLAQ